MRHKKQEGGTEEIEEEEEEGEEEKPIPFSKFKTEKLKSAYEHWYWQMAKIVCDSIELWNWFDSKGRLIYYIDFYFFGKVTFRMFQMCNMTQKMV